MLLTVIILDHQRDLTVLASLAGNQFSAVGIRKLDFSCYCMLIMPKNAFQLSPVCLGWHLNNYQIASKLLLQIAALRRKSLFSRWKAWPSGYGGVVERLWWCGRVAMVVWPSGYGGVVEWLWWCGRVVMVVWPSGYGGVAEWLWWCGRVVMVVWPSGYGGVVEWLWWCGRVVMVVWSSGYGGVVDWLW